MKQTLVTVLLLFFFSLLKAQSRQQVLASSGSFTSNGNVSLSTTVGEPVIFTFSIPSTKLTQGFQQPYYETDSVVSLSGIDIVKVFVYPNPSSELIVIDLTDCDIELAKLNVTDVLGKTLFSQRLKVNELNTVYLNNLESGQYFFNVIDSKGNLLSTHKIQKIN